MATETRTCYRHTDVPAGVSCQRCERPICPACMVTASVGFHCPECARGGRQKVYTARTLHVVNRPLVTYTLIGINVLVQVVVLAAAGRSRDALGGEGDVYTDWALNAFAVSDLGEWWRLVTAGFLHYGLLHLGMNMFALWMLGQQLEPAAGRLRFAAMYMVALLAGSLGALILDPFALTAGASGAIYGLLGAAFAGQRAAGMRISDSNLLGVLVINLAFTFAVPGISIGGHIGGLVGGFIAGYLVFDVGRRGRQSWLPLAGCAAVAAIVVAASLYVAANPLT